MLLQDNTVWGNMTRWQKWMKEYAEMWYIIHPPSGVYHEYFNVTPEKMGDTEWFTTNIGLPFYISGTATTLVSFYHYNHKGEDCTLIDILYKIQDVYGFYTHRIQYLADKYLPTHIHFHDKTIGTWYRKHIENYEPIVRWTEGGKKKCISLRSYIVNEICNGSENLWSGTVARNGRVLLDPMLDCDIRKKDIYRNRTYDTSEHLSEMDWLFYSQSDQNADLIRTVIERYNTCLDVCKIAVTDLDSIDEVITLLQDARVKLKSNISSHIRALTDVRNKQK